MTIIRNPSEHPNSQPTPKRALQAYRNAQERAGHLRAQSLSVMAVPVVLGTPLALGLHPSPDDAQDYPLVPSGRPALSVIDYRGELPGIKDQKTIGSCTAWETLAHADRYNILAGKHDELSALGNYAMSRDYLGLTGDSGATLRGALKVAQKYGIPLETVYPYDVTKVNTLTLPDAVYADAATRKIGAYYRIDTWLAEAAQIARRVDAALADGYTVGIGMFVHRWFFYLTGPMETHLAQRDPSNATRFGISPDNWWDVMGGHAVTIVGRDDAKGGYITRNQWGTNWGDAGYTITPFADMIVLFELWAVAGFNGSNAKPAPYDINSNEAQAARLYRAAFNRCPDAAGLAFQTNAVAQYGLTAVAANFLASPEFSVKYGPGQTPEQYVTALYLNVLGRAPDASGLQFHLNALASGTTRPQLLTQFSESPENKSYGG